MRNIIIFLIGFLVIGCAHLDTVEPLIEDKKFQEENQPIIETSVLVIVNSQEDMDVLIAGIENHSRNFILQVGISYKISKIIITDHPLVSEISLLVVASMNKLKHGIDYDIAVGMRKYNFIEILGAIGVVPVLYKAQTDKSCRCFILIKSHDMWSVSHELAHVYLKGRKRDHYPTGLMASFPSTIELIPGVPIGGKSFYLSKEARKDVLKNKWRYFYGYVPPALIVTAH